MIIDCTYSQLDHLMVGLHGGKTCIYGSACRPSARWLSGRMPDSQSRDPGFESPLIPFRSLGIFFHFTTPQSTQLYK